MLLLAACLSTLSTASGCNEDSSSGTASRAETTARADLLQAFIPPADVAQDFVFIDGPRNALGESELGGCTDPLPLASATGRYSAVTSSSTSVYGVSQEVVQFPTGAAEAAMATARATLDRCFVRIGTASGESGGLVQEFGSLGLDSLGDESLGYLQVSFIAGSNVGPPVIVMTLYIRRGDIVTQVSVSAEGTNTLRDSALISMLGRLADQRLIVAAPRERSGATSPAGREATGGAGEPVGEEREQVLDDLYAEGSWEPRGDPCRGGIRLRLSTIDPTYGVLFLDNEERLSLGCQVGDGWQLLHQDAAGAWRDAGSGSDPGPCGAGLVSREISEQLLPDLPCS